MNSKIFSFKLSLLFSVLTMLIFFLSLQALAKDKSGATLKSIQRLNDYYSSSVKLNQTTPTQPSDLTTENIKPSDIEKTETRIKPPDLQLCDPDQADTVAWLMEKKLGININYDPNQPMILMNPYAIYGEMNFYMNKHTKTATICDMRWSELRDPLSNHQRKIPMISCNEQEFQYDLKIVYTYVYWADTSFTVTRNIVMDKIYANTVQNGE